VSSSPLWLPPPFGIEGRPPHPPRLPRRRWRRYLLSAKRTAASGVIAQDEAGEYRG